MDTINAFTTLNILILDDNPADALLVRQMLQSLSGWTLSCETHRSDEGILPQNLKAKQPLHLILVAEGYANTQMQQMLELLRFFQADAKIVLLSNNAGINVAPQEFIAAAHAGLLQWLQKEKLSVNALHSLLNDLFPTAKSDTPHSPLVKQDAQHFLPKAIRRSASDIAASAEETLKPATNDNITDTLADQQSPASTETNDNSSLFLANDEQSLSLDLLSVGLIEFEACDEGYLYKAINRSAALSEHLDRDALINTLLQAQTQHYENFDLIECLNSLKQIGDRQKAQALSLAANEDAIWKNLTAHRISDNRIVLEIQDISEQVALHNAQKQTANIWQEIVRSLPDLSILVDEEGSIVELISGDWQQIRSDESNLRGVTFTSLLQDNDRQLYQDQLSKVLNTGKHQTAVFCLEISDSRLWLHCKFALLRTEASAERRVLIVCHDISEQQEHMQMLVGDLNINKELFLRAPFAMAYKDNEGRFERANPYFLDIFQLRQDDLLGKTEGECLEEADAELLSRLEQGVAESGDIAHLELQFSSADLQTFQAVLLPLREDSSHSIRSCLILIPSNPSLTHSTNTQAAKHQFAEDSKKKSPR